MMRHARAALLVLPLLLATFQSPAQNGGRTVEMKVDGLVCAFCAQGIRKNLRAQPSVEDVIVDLEHGVVAVALREGKDIEDETLRTSLTQAGYALRHIERSSEPLGEIRARLAGARK